MSEEFSLPTATSAHESLSPFAGRFKAEVQMWFGPGDSMVSTGTMVSSWHLNGLYLHQDYKGDAVEGPFPNFEGKGYWGFNTVAQQYEGFWIDTASTVMQMESGSVDGTGKVWTMHSEIPNPHGEGTMKKRTVITLVDADNHKMEAYLLLPDGNEFKNMEINYVRTS